MTEAAKPAVTALATMIVSQRRSAISTNGKQHAELRLVGGEGRDKFRRIPGAVPDNSKRSADKRRGEESVLSGGDVPQRGRESRARQ